MKVHVGLVISVVLHIVLLGWALLSVHWQRELTVSEPEPVAVDLLAPSELTQLRQGVRTAKPDAEPKEAPRESVQESPKEAKVQSVAAAPATQQPSQPDDDKAALKAAARDPIAEKLAALPAPAEAAAPPDPAIEQQRIEEKQREEARRAEQKLEEEKRAAELKKKEEEERRKKEAELKRKREEEKRRREEAKKKQFDAAKIAALLNKVPDKGGPAAAQPTEQPAKRAGPVLGAPEGRDRQLSASEIAILGQIIRSCVQSKWNILGGGEAAQHTEVKMRLRFNPDGTLAAPPQVTNTQNTPYFLAVSDSAVRAVQQCEPFPLPAPKYEFWKDMILTFRPSDMF